MSLIAVEEALRRVLATAPATLETEWVGLAEARGRTLSRDVHALRTQPPTAVSAMDGYAVRAADLADPLRPLALIGVSAAGRGFDGTVGSGQAVRIFTGAPLPAGADTVLMQENADAVPGAVTPLQAEPVGRHLRPAGLDFREGERGLPAGRRLGASDLALAAAMNHPRLPVVRAPRVAILATGDELVLPGSVPGPAQIVASNTFALRAIVEAAGGVPIDLGIAADRLDALDERLTAAEEGGADLLVTLGGASVGDHDLVQRALLARGMELGFWKVALRPGKPMLHGLMGDVRVLGLPGNPVSSIVCGVLFVQPLLRALSGDPRPGLPRGEPAILAGPLQPNGDRQDYVRAVMTVREGELPRVAPAAMQDSSMLKVLADAEALIVRPAWEPAVPAGAPCVIIRLDRLLQ